MIKNNRLIWFRRMMAVVFLLSGGLSFAWDLDQEYVDKTNNFKLKYPASWQVKGSPESKDLVKADINSPDNKAGIQVRVYKSNHKSFDEFIDWYVAQFLREMKNVVMLDGGYKAIGYKTGYAVRFDGSRRNGYFLKSYIILAADVAYVFQSGAPSNEQDTYESILDAIVQSFETL